MATTAAVAGLRAAGLAGLLALVGAGAAGLVAGFLERSASSTAVVEQAVTALDVETGTGDVTVEVAPAGSPLRYTALRHWSFTEPGTSGTVEAGTLRLRSTCGGGGVFGRCSVDWTVSVPAATTVTLSTGTGDVRVTGTSGGVAVSTGTGDVDLRALGARTVTVGTGTGQVRLRAATVPDRVEVSTGTGDVDVRVPGGVAYRVTGDSGPGERTTRVQESDTSPHVVQVDTGVGDVLVATT